MTKPIWPTQAEILSNKSVYGNPRGKDPALMSPSWEAENIVRITPPFAMRYAGAPVKSIRVHRHCANSLLRVFNNLLAAAKAENPKSPQAVLDHWGVSVFGGVVQYRLMRGLNTLSLHGYGAAIDLDPARNGLADRTPRFAEFPPVLKAFADEGWRWGGDWNGNGLTSDERRCDGMHWQASR